MECPDDFTEFAEAELARLRRTADLLCGDWHAAEDLTQIALTKTLLAWRRISKRENAHAYAHRTLVNAYLGQRRTRKSGEIPLDTLPDHTGQPGTAELRLVLAVQVDEGITSGSAAGVVPPAQEARELDAVRVHRRALRSDGRAELSRSHQLRGAVVRAAIAAAPGHHLAICQGMGPPAGGPVSLLATNPSLS